MVGRWARIGLGLVGALALPATARADIPAVPCADDPYYCTTAPVSFAYEPKDALDFDFDTGWVPSNSDLQVHLFGGLWATTKLSLSGRLETRWPEALTLTAPGNLAGGSLLHHYGVEIGAEGKIDISVLGQTISWTGDLPYVPQVDLQVAGATVFNAWGFPPGATLTSSSQPQKVATIGLGSLVGIPGLDGGFELDVAIDLSTTWVASAVALARPDGDAVVGGPITAPDGDTRAEQLADGATDVDMSIEGTLTYEPTVHLVPALYVEFLGQKFSIPVADVPVALPATDVDVVLGPERVHIPLPHVTTRATRIDFGDVPFGGEATRALDVRAEGEGPVHAVVAPGLPGVFVVDDGDLELEPGAEAAVDVVFRPDTVGPVQQTLYLLSNDPDAPIQTLELVGNGTFDGLLSPPRSHAAGASADEGGCACRAARSPGSTSAPLAAVGLGLALVALGRRRGRR